ncbi:MAG: hypothetical protein ACAI37_18450 [Chthoniobacter sp.]
MKGKSNRHNAAEFLIGEHALQLLLRAIDDKLAGEKHIEARVPYNPGGPDLRGLNDGCLSAAKAVAEFIINCRANGFARFTLILRENDTAPEVYVVPDSFRVESAYDEELNDLAEKLSRGGSLLCEVFRDDW